MENTINIGQDYPGDGFFAVNDPSNTTGGTLTVKLNANLAITSTAASAYMVIFPQNFTGFFYNYIQE